MYKLVIANRNYSSWSLRAWLFLRESDIPFEEIRIPLFTDDWRENVAKYSPAGRVPVLVDGDITVWDTSAIFDYVRETHTDAVGWPAGKKMRAQARSISAEMHSGFLAIRDELPQNIRARNKRELSHLSESCRQQIVRVDDIWANCRTKYSGGGRWLFGTFSIADVMFAPVALRFVTYDIPVSDNAREFIDAVRNLGSVQEWVAAASSEPESLEFIDELVPAASSPLTLG